MADKVYLSVEIPISGEVFPNSRELGARNRIIAELDRRGIGNFVGAGGGMGSMDFSYVVDDESRARREVAAAIERFLPGALFDISSLPAEQGDFERTQTAGNGDKEEDDVKLGGGEAQINWLRLTISLAIAVAVVALVVWGVWKIID